MDLNSKHKVSATFSMSSMTDVIFLLLIFFMLTSSFITPSGIFVSYASSKETKILMQKVSVTVTEDLRFYVNDNPTELEDLENVLRREFAGSEERKVILHIDKGVPSEYLIKIAGIAAHLEAKVSVAAKPE